VEVYFNIRCEIWLKRYLNLAKRRLNPQSDLISALLTAEIDNVQLGEEDILSFCWLLLVAGK